MKKYFKNKRLFTVLMCVICFVITAISFEMVVVSEDSNGGESTFPKWDVNQDGTVNILDLVLVGQNLGSQNPQADVNEDGTVNVLDLVLVANHFGESVAVTPPPPPQIPEGMVLIPAGEFQMGDDSSERVNERPAHTVYVDAFYMDTHKVTNAEYKKFVDANREWQKGFANDDFVDGGYLGHWNGNKYPEGEGNHPVHNVSWFAAMNYAKWVGKRLPTEAEWEKAARGDLIDKKYPWGNETESMHQRANTTNTIVPVGSYPPNGYGLYDMVGNVQDMCLDLYFWEYPYPPAPRRNPIVGAASVDEMVDDYLNVVARIDLLEASVGADLGLVVRGFGHWEDYGVASRSYIHRPSDSSGGGSGLVGFRCVKPVSD